MHHSLSLWQTPALIDKNGRSCVKCQLPLSLCTINGAACPSNKQFCARPSPPFLARKFGVSISIGGRHAPLINIGAARVAAGGPQLHSGRPHTPAAGLTQANRARRLLLRRRANNRISNFIFSGWASFLPGRARVPFMGKKLCAPFYSRWIRLCIIIWLYLIRKQRGFSPEQRVALLKAERRCGKSECALTFYEESSLSGFNFHRVFHCESKVFCLNYIDVELETITFDLKTLMKNASRLILNCAIKFWSFSAIKFLGLICNKN